MDDSPDGGLQPGEVSPEPCHSPGTGRPLPDLIAIRLAEVPDSWPPYDDEVAIAGAGRAMWPGGARSGGMGGQRRNRATPGLDGGNAAGRKGGQATETGGRATETGGRATDTGGRAQDGEAHGDGEAPGRRGEPRGDRAGLSDGDADADRDRDRDRDGDRDSDGDGNGDGDGDGNGDGNGNGDGDGNGEGEGEGPGQWPSQFAQVLAEALAGARPASQMTPWTTERARAHIRRLGPLLAAGQRPRVQRVLTSRPVDDVVEIAVIVGFGPRTRALAARLERASPQAATPGRPGRQARWLCTAIESA